MQRERMRYLNVTLWHLVLKIAISGMRKQKRSLFRIKDMKLVLASSSVMLVTPVEILLSRVLQSGWAE